MMIKKLLAIALFFPVLLIAQPVKKYPALLWKITGNGLKKPSYLYGTMHVSNRVAYHLSEQFFDAIKNVDVVGLETNPGEWLENMEKTGELSQVNQFSSLFRYGQSFYKSSFSYATTDKRTLQGIISYDPDIINGLLYRHNRSRENFEENTYIDLFIFQTASKLGKQLISLEDFVQSEIKARLSAIPDEESDDDNYGNYKNYYSAGQKIEDAYRNGNLDLLDSLSKLTSTKNTQRYLINDRNVFFVNTIDSVLKTKSIFSGIGAAHLPGQDGVIELLRKKGYTVEPIIPNVSKKSDKLRDEYDAKIKPVTFGKQFINDSLFSVSVPGKLSQIVDLENVKYNIYADMVNGSFYTIVRLKYLGPLSNVTSNQMLQKVDSLLFENIPGKITLKKEIVSNNGLKGIEIVNKTRRGDEQHYQIYFNDLEMIVFKLGGKGQYATGNEAKQFFNSIQFFNKNEAFTDFSPKTKGFSSRVPANFSYVKNEGSSMKGLVEDLYAYQKSTKQFFGIKHVVYNDFDYLEEDTFELNIFSKEILSNYDFKENIKREIKEEQGFPCIRISAKNKQGGTFYGKLFIKGVHYYLVYNISEKEGTFESEFFNSFKLNDFVLANKTKEITDKDFYFKAIDEVSDNAYTRFNEDLSKQYEAAKSKKEKESEVLDYDYHTSSKSYYSPSCNEYVSIFYEKYNDYDYRTKKELEENIASRYKGLNGLQLTHIQTEEKNGIYTYKTILKDTATRRAIDMRIFIKGGMAYEISAPFDTVIGLRSWTKDFMNSFTPKDTIIGKNIFEYKFNKLLDDLCSSDTSARQKATNSLLNSVSIQKAATDDFIKFVGDKRFALVNEDAKAQLLVNGGTLETEKIIAPYKNLYKQYTDSFYLQLCVLKGLAYLKTPTSYNTFYSLLMNEVPLVGNDETVSNVFSVLHDSLELCKSFFPGILTLTKYDEYKSSVYTLLSSMVNKGIINGTVYQAQKEFILADANLALKRFTPSKNSSSDYSGEYGGYKDKLSRELEEALQNSLNGLSNNNLYKGSSYLKGYEDRNRPELVKYAFILAPFYKTDEKTKQFFTKLNKLKTPSNITMPVFIKMLKQDVILNDTLLTYYCKNKTTRVYFYSELEKEKLSGKFLKEYLNQEGMIESVVWSQKALSASYNYGEKDKKQKDSLYLFKTIEAHNKYQKGKIYIYKSSKSKPDNETWSVAFVKDSKEAINTNIEVIDAEYYVSSKKTEEENINDILNDFYLSFRKRAGSGGSSLYGDYE